MPEFLRVLFNFEAKHSPEFFLAEMLLFRFVAFIVHASILSSFFSETKCKAAQNIQGNVLLLKLKSTCKNSSTFERKKIHPKKSLRSVLQQAIQFTKFGQRKSWLPPGWISDPIQHRFWRSDFCFLLSSGFDWEDILKTGKSVLPHFQKHQSSSKILRCTLHVQLSSRCLGVRSTWSFKFQIYFGHFLKLGIN